jgi:hypothetical protein
VTVREMKEGPSGSANERLHFCYEAGPTGYGLHRQLTDLGHIWNVWTGALGRRLDLLFARQRAHGANKLSDLASPGNRLGAIAPVLEVVPVTLQRPR